ncbi:MAG: hypothetical protein JWO94_387 [Verrucomicrobiaceae bacterium]|nr:hypothetical protein [Verrucomicrobiaceae bacterium]
MKLTPVTLARMALLMVTLGLASCSLPPEAAWHVVKTDGLLPLIAMELGARPYPPGLGYCSGRPVCNSYMGSAYDRVKPVPSSSTPLVVLRTDEDGPKPFPPRPDAVVSRSAEDSPHAAPRPPRPNLITKKRSETVPQPSVVPEVEHSPAVIASVKPRIEPEAVNESHPQEEEKKSKNVEVASAPVPSQPLNPASQPPVRAIEESLPYGTAIPGRPGLVNSPYAAKNQFVDVAGLKPGQEVKCPYSGKLFRVPVGAQASAAKPAEQDDKRQ